MLFNSYIFVLLFLPLAVSGYWLINRFASIIYARWYLIIMSVWFYSYVNWKHLWMLLLSMVVNFGIYRGIITCQSIQKRKILLGSGLVFNVGSLCFYKYFHFFADNINSILGTDLIFEKIIMPLGISYIVFQQIAFIVDTYKGETQKYLFKDYLLFILYFPRVISGPIIFHNEFFPQLEDKGRQKVNWDNIAKGFYLFAIGLGKKVLLADTFGKAVDYAYGLMAEDGVRSLYALDLAIIILAYTFQLYFDFSGYSDMAIGVSRMFNIELPINFNSPYKALTITDFWKRWHITLTRFLTKYIYIPLGGNRKGTIRTYLNILIVFAISGLWHGTGLTFLVWGLMHGVFQIIERAFKKIFVSMHPVLSWCITFGFVNIAWVFFRAETVHQAVEILVQFARMSFTSLNDGLVETFNLPELVWLSNEVLPIDILAHYPNIFCFAFILLGFWIMLGFRNSVEKMDVCTFKLKDVLFVTIIMVWCIFSFTGISTFIYWSF